MKIVKLACPNCGSKLKVENDKKNITCDYCHSELYLDDETQKYEIVIKNKLKIEGISTVEDKFEIAQKYYKMKNYDKCLGYLEAILANDPFNVDALLLKLKYKLEVLEECDEETEDEIDRLEVGDSEKKHTKEIEHFRKLCANIPLVEEINNSISIEAYNFKDVLKDKYKNEYSINDDYDFEEILSIINKHINSVTSEGVEGQNKSLIKYIVYFIVLIIIVFLIVKLMIKIVDEQVSDSVEKSSVLSFRDINDDLLMTSQVLKEECASVDIKPDNSSYRVKLNIENTEKFYNVTKELSERENDENIIVIWVDFEEGIDSFKKQKNTCGTSENKKCISYAYVNNGLGNSSIVLEFSSFSNKEEVERTVDLINRGCKNKKFVSDESTNYDYDSSYRCAVRVAEQYNIKNCTTFKKFLEDEPAYIYTCGYNGNISIRIINGKFDINVDGKWVQTAGKC